ncbi:MAG: glycerophosphodiester phosphodiesterase family protein [Polyangiales bacterium]
MRPLLFAVLLVACSSKSEASEAHDAGDDQEAAAPPPLDPKLFDCTAKAPPTRKSKVPEACLRDPSCKTRLVSAHRGAGGDLGRIAPEDTLAAYRAGIAMGVDLVETDPRPTKDGVIVNIHDPTLDRTTSGHGAVDQIIFDDLRKLTIKTGELQGDFSCEKVPTLKELLETCRGNALVLVDGNKTDRVDLMVQAIKDADALDWAVFDTSSLDKIDQALAIEPKLMIMPRVGTIDEATMVLAKYKDHLPVFVEVEATAFPKPAEAIHAGGSRVLTDVFTTDVIVKLGTSPKEKYLDVYAAGADVAQSDLPDLVLQALGRPVPP